ncbi:MAG TPA: Ig-like domain-containing protein, partial [Spirochaetota bacterium]
MKRLSVFILVGSLIILGACSKGGGKSSKTPYIEPNPPSADTAPPFISSCVASSDKTIVVTFSEPVTPDSTGKPTSYTIQSSRSPVTVTTATPDSNPLKVTLTLDKSMAQGTTYQLDAKSISDIAGNVLADGKFTFTGRGPVAAVLSDLPPALTNTRETSITVSGDDLTGYQYALNNGSWSGEKKISEKINLTGLAEGTVEIKVAGKDSLGNWQSFSTPTSYTWQIDTTAPVSSLENAPARITNQKNLVIRVTGDQVRMYKYKINGGSWSDDTDQNDPIELDNVDDGNYTLTVLGRDAAGNWQSDSQPTTAQWVVDSSIPAAVLEGVPALL